MLEALENIDTSLFLWLNNLHLSWMDPIMVAISYKFTWVPLYIVCVFIIAKKFGVRSALLILLFIILLVTLSDQSSVFLKNTFKRYRPCHNLDIQNLIHLAKGSCGGKYSFVSSHATNTFAFAAFTANMLNTRVAVTSMFIWASIVSYSRIYLGVHYPADIIGGCALGLSIGWSVSYLSLKILGKYFPSRLS